MIILATSCRPKFYEEPSLNSGTPSAGSVNFSKYVSVGASIDAGFMDGALYNEGQSVAYPNLIAQQLRSVNPNLVFNQPNIGSINGFSTILTTGGVSKIVGRFLFAAVSCQSQNFNRTQQTGDLITSYSGDKSSLNNFGIPYLNVNQLNSPLSGTPSAYSSNSGNDPRWYYSNVVPSPGVSKLSSVVKSTSPTFFTAWIGYTEFLNYVQRGGSVALPVIDTVNISNLLDSLLANGGKGVIANIPDVTLFPIVYNNNRRFTNTSDPILNKPISTSSVLGTSIKAYSF
ncbi:MAG: hypothetical protein K2Q22_00260, partial [Cytophagales bacterium]|nr:hypothetical protein [Cytophagales bacterium]